MPDLNDHFPHIPYGGGSNYLIDMDALHDGDVKRLMKAFPHLSLKDAVATSFMSGNPLITDTPWEVIPEGGWEDPARRPELTPPEPTYEPWSDGAVTGFRCVIGTRTVGYVYLAPAGATEPGVPEVAVYAHYGDTDPTTEDPLVTVVDGAEWPEDLT